MNRSRSLEGDGRLQRTLLVVTPYFPPLGGGLEIYAQSVATLLARQHGWRVVVVTSGSRRGGQTVTTEGSLVVYRLPRQFCLSNTPFSIRWVSQLRRIIKNEAPSVINAHGPVPGLADLAAAVAGQIPVVVTWHAGSMKKGRPVADVAIRAYEEGPCRWLLHRADWIISSSDFVRDSFLAQRQSKCSTVTPGVDAVAFTPAVRDNARVLFVGGLKKGDAHKGLDALLRAVAQLRVDRPEVVLEVVGEGDDRERYGAAAAALGIGDAVHFSGRLTGGELVSAYQRATVLGLPTRNDSFPMVLLEAMACAVPVVTTTVGSIPTIVDHGANGLLVAPDDHEALCWALDKIIADPVLAADMGQSGREKVARELGWERAAERFNSVLEAVVVGRPDHRSARPAASGRRLGGSRRRVSGPRERLRP
jgi:glycosyltransferase involved in cell wall biosynthesis